MKVQLKADHVIGEDTCATATGKPLSHWIEQIAASPELASSRREAINWLYAQMNKDAWWATTAWVEYEASRGIIKKDGRPEGYNICVTKTIAAPLHKVFASFDAAGLADWFGSIRAEGDTISDESGNRLTVLRVRDGKDHRWKWQTAGVESETDIDILFNEKAGKTGIVLNHNRIPSREEADGLRVAWGEALARLKSLLESQ
ncbi:MAG TPA: SRPBCC domain-containing protein [Fimbriimonadaceae bacterium]|nr:SRPBCC domain-containing protein [Fimbriimonadaceae bacterium]HRJ95232.1 SRPBCC domain-containing protein [Fimbriimonadaceae bacterium]